MKLRVKARIREETRITLAWFQSGLNIEIRDRVELLSFHDLNDLVQVCVRVKKKIKRKLSFNTGDNILYGKKKRPCVWERAIRINIKKKINIKSF